MSETREVLRQLARESGRLLGELGVRTDDREWIDTQAETIASLASETRRRRGGWLYRLARRAARTAR